MIVINRYDCKKIDVIKISELKNVNSKFFKKREKGHKINKSRIKKLNKLDFLYFLPLK